jgi:hypothetical protein
MDSAFFDGGLLEELEALGVEFTASVPFERLPELKSMIERRRHWRSVDAQWQYFEIRWKPKRWSKKRRFICIRQITTDRRRGPLQLDLFVPVEPTARYTVLATNKRAHAKSVIAFHHGRGSQEGLFAEAKSHAQLGYIPVRHESGNWLFRQASMLARNLAKELQLETSEGRRRASESRHALWDLLSLRTLRSRLLLRAARTTRPQNRLTLNANEAAESAFRKILGCLTDQAA